MRRSAIVALICLMSLGCDAGFLVESPRATCDKTGAQCVLPAGVLGVCERASCYAGTTVPCYVCTPQH